MNEWLLTVDPGVNGCGWAYWHVAPALLCPQLTQVGYGDVPKCIKTYIVVELPQIYPGSRGKGDPNNLIRLAFAAGRVVGDDEHETVLPRTWKGTIAKDVMLRRILKRLTDYELKLISGLGLPVSKEHNVVDAVGIGLWKLGRL